jgi:hypothetical protein
MSFRSASRKKERAMARPDIETVILAIVPTELEAELILEALEERGIRAEEAGQLTAGFRAEAPGGVRILVRREDAERGLAALREFERERSDIDWTKIDLGPAE